MGVIEELARMREQWKGEGKISNGDGGNGLFFRPEDRAFGYFLWDGQSVSEGKHFMYYLVHQYPATPAAKWGIRKPCLASIYGPNAKCEGCEHSLKTKEQMAMYVWVYGILHQQLREGEQFPYTTFGGFNGYWRDVNAVKLWDTSAWRDSPMGDIATMSTQGLIPKYMFQFYAAGAEKNRRYKVFPQFDTGPLSPDIMGAALAEVKPIVETIAAKVTPTATAPGAAPGQNEYRVGPDGRVLETAAPLAAPPSYPAAAAPAPFASAPPRLAQPMAPAPAPPPVPAVAPPAPPAPPAAAPVPAVPVQAVAIPDDEGGDEAAWEAAAQEAAELEQAKAQAAAAPVAAPVAAPAVAAPVPAAPVPAAPAPTPARRGRSLY